jgi:hypothetical protein
MCSRSTSWRDRLSADNILGNPNIGFSVIDMDKPVQARSREQRFRWHDKHGCRTPTAIALWQRFHRSTVHVL